MRTNPLKALLGNFDLMKNAVIRRLNQLLGIRPHEKVNFDLIKFDLLIISRNGWAQSDHIK